MGFQSLFSSMEGRIGRGTYWIGLIGIAVVSFVAGLILWRIFGEHLIPTGGGHFAQFVVAVALCPNQLLHRAVKLAERHVQLAQVTVPVLQSGLVGLWAGQR
jgi:uncharacterized membrane protein YhaH (DUF805 family)